MSNLLAAFSIGCQLCSKQDIAFSLRRCHWENAHEFSPLAELRSETLMLIFGCFSMIIGLYVAVSKMHWRLSDEMPSVAKSAVLSSGMEFICVLMGIGGSSLGVPIMTLHGRSTSGT